MSDAYDRDWRPMTLKEWAIDRAGDFKTKRRVAETTLPNGRWISTVWLGIDHSFDSGPPLIFETMVFPKRGECGELDCERYSTEEQARAGHARLCEKWAIENPE